MSPLVGFPRRPSLVAALQPRHRPTPNLDRFPLLFRLLDVAPPRRLSTADDPHHAGHEPALSVLDPHRTRPLAGTTGVGPQFALAPPRPSRIKRPLSRQESRGHAH